MSMQQETGRVGPSESDVALSPWKKQGKRNKVYCLNLDDVDSALVQGPTVRRSSDLATTRRDLWSLLLTS